MRTVASVLRSAGKINLEALIALSFYDSTDEYIKLQQEQMQAGQLSTGKQIFNRKTKSYEYSPGYAKYKRKSEPIDLKDTGAFQADIYITKQSDEAFKIDSADEKSNMLQENYGKQIFGLNKDSKIKFKPVAQKVLLRNLESELR